MKVFSAFWYVGLVVNLLSTFAADPSRAQSNSRWVSSPTSDTVFVFVHGILSNSDAGWTHADGSFWPKILAEDARFGKPGVYVAGYPTSLDDPQFGIEDAAEHVFGRLNSTDGGTTRSVLSNSQIVFIAHSTGGLVVRQMLLRHDEHFKNKELELFLLASPSRGSEWADRLGGLTRQIKHKMALQLSRNSDFVVRLDKSFSEFVARRKIWMLAGMDVFESRFIIPYWYFFETTRVVDPDESRYYFGEPRLVPQSDHFSISKPSLISSRDADRFPHEYLWEFYEQRFKPEIKALARCTSQTQNSPNSPSELSDLTWNKLFVRSTYTFAQADSSTLTQTECFQRRIAELARQEQPFSIENGVRCEGGGIKAKSDVQESQVEYTTAPPGWAILGSAQATTLSSNRGSTGSVDYGD